MTYIFTPKTDEELGLTELLPHGVYNFEVMKSERMTSKAGNPQSKLQLGVWDNEGRIRVIFDYLVFADNKFCMRKVKHFADAVGLVEEYKKGEFPEELARLCGKVEIGIDEEKPKPEGGFYPKKNFVKDYVKSDSRTSSTMKTLPEVKEEFNDDLPF